MCTGLHSRHSCVALLSMVRSFEIVASQPTC